MTVEDARRLALPDTVEQDHNGRPSLRVAGKMVATIWDEQTMNVMLDEPGTRTAVAEHPGSCAERCRGKRLAAVAADLATTTEHELDQLFADAGEGETRRPAA